MSSGYISPGLMSLPPAQLAAILADIDRRLAEAPPPSKASVEAVGRLVEQFSLEREGGVDAA